MILAGTTLMIGGSKNCRCVWGPPVVDAILTQVRFKRSKKRKMHHRVMNDVKRETLGLPPGPSLGAIIGNPESPYTIAKNIKQHMARLTANDTTSVRRKKDFGRFNFHRILKMAGIGYPKAGHGTGLTQLQDQAELPVGSLFHDRFPFPHTVQYRAYWGPPTFETEPNRYEGSMVGVSVCFRVTDLLLKQEEVERLIAIVGPSRFDEETGVVTLDADIFPDRNHNAAFLGDMLQHLLRAAVEEKEI